MKRTIARADKVIVAPDWRRDFDLKPKHKQNLIAIAPLCWLAMTTIITHALGPYSRRHSRFFSAEENGTYRGAHVLSMEEYLNHHYF